MSQFIIKLSGDALNLQDISEEEVVALRHESSLAVSTLVQAHFETLPGEGFYSRAARSVEMVKTPESDSIAVTQVGVSLQFFGGIVKAGKGVSSKTGKKTKFLAIPARKGLESPSYYKGKLSFFFNKGKKSARLVMTPAKGDKARPPVMFWLVKQTKHKPHPEILPSLERVEAAIVEGGSSYLNALSFLK